jgi:hypothetical protein
MVICLFEVIARQSQKSDYVSESITHLYIIKGMGSISSFDILIDVVNASVYTEKKAW